MIETASISAASAKGGDRSADEIAASLMAEWAKANIASESEVLASMYTQNALFFGSVTELRAGHLEILEYFRAVPKGGVKDVIFTETRAVWLSPEVIVVGGFVDFELNFTGSPELRKWRIMLTLARQVDGQWRIAGHHAAAK